jgi:hypothetical protein
MGIVRWAIIASLSLPLPVRPASRFITMDRLMSSILFVVRRGLFSRKVEHNQPCWFYDFLFFPL